MPVSIVPVIAGLLAAVIVWALARYVPRADPVAPRVSTTTISETVEASPRLRRILRRRLDPTRATGMALTAALALVALAVVGAGLLLLMVRHNAGFARWDLTFASWGANHATPGAAQWLRRESQLGGTLIVVTLAAVVALVELRRVRSYQVLTLLVVSVGGQYLLVAIVKGLVDRARPAIDQLTGFSSTSFPSGHAAAAAAAYATFALLLGRGRSHRAKVLLAAVAAGMAVMVASTRVLLGVHWFTDVLAGVITGWGWFALCSIAFGGRLLHFGAPVETAEQAAGVRPG
ncbi:MAG: phosphatase PAP2 family protein [Acidobacteria bacterium]|nr:phosphatase PAP2 family protein [Acidobacteriota bacterium]